MTKKSIFNVINNFNLNDIDEYKLEFIRNKILAESYFDKVLNRVKLMNEGI